MNEYERYTQETVVCQRDGCQKRRLPSKMLNVIYPHGTMKLCSRMCADKVWDKFQLSLSLFPSSNTGVKTGTNSFLGNAK